MARNTPARSPLNFAMGGGDADGFVWNIGPRDANGISAITVEGVPVTI